MTRDRTGAHRWSPTLVVGAIGAALIIVGCGSTDQRKPSARAAVTVGTVTGERSSAQPTPAETRSVLTGAPASIGSPAPPTSVSPPTSTVARRTAPSPIPVPGHDDRPTLLLRGAVDTAPLIVVFHGSRGSIENVQGRSGLDAAAADAGVAVLWLSGKPLPERSWNTNNRCCAPASTEKVDDLAYIDAAIAEVRQRGLKPVRIVAAGVSNGAGMAVSTACKRSRVFTAAVSIGGWLPVTCRDRSVSLVAIAGTEDDVIGRQTARDMARMWRRTVVGCDGDATVVERGLATISTWSDCRDATYVRLVQLDGIGHEWPRLIDYDATDEIISAANGGW